MRSRVVVWLLLFAAAGALPAAEVAAPPAATSMTSAHVDDSGGVLRALPSASADLETRLAGFEHASGVRIIARFHPHSPPAEEDVKPGVFMHALATRLGVARSGVLAVYFADEDDWRIWIGDDLAATFAGRSGSVEELTASDAIHDAKEAFFATAGATSDALFAAWQQTAGPDQPPASTVRVKLHADAILDGLMDRFGRK
jgi:hypothetical protein